MAQYIWVGRMRAESRAYLMLVILLSSVLSRLLQQRLMTKKPLGILLNHGRNMAETPVTAESFPNMATVA